jgi:hypothetical protein
VRSYNTFFNTELPLFTPFMHQMRSISLFPFKSHDVNCSGFATQR